MNANQVRPLLAFWLLALAAAVITVLGLRAPGTEARGPSGSPAPVTHSGSPSLVLGGLLQPEPTNSSTASSRAGRWSSATALEHAAGHDGSTVTARATGAVTKTAAPTSTAEASAPASAGATPTGKARPHDGSGSGTTTTTATATATTTETGHGKGQGNGRGPGDPDNPGKGH